MSDMATVKNTGRGVISLGRYGRLVPGGTCEVPREDLPKVRGGFIVELGKDGNPVDPHDLRERKRSGKGGKAKTEEEQPDEQTFLAGFGEELTKDEANAITTYYGVEDRELARWLGKGEINGARKTGDQRNAPWSIPKSGLLARVAKFQESA